METRANHLLVGGFVLLVLAAFAVAVVWLTRAQLVDRTTPYHIYFTGSVTGLVTASTVRYRGVPIGTVTDIRIAPNNPELVRVTIQVPEGTPIKEDAVATLELQGVTGGAYVQILGGSRDSAPLRPEEGQEVAVIPSRPSGVAAVLERAPELLGRMIALTDRVNLLLSDQNVAAIGETIGNVRDITGSLKTASGDMAAMLGSIRTVSGEVERLVAGLDIYAATLTDSVDRTMTQARSTLGSIERQAGQAGSEWQELTASLRRTSDEMHGILADVREPVSDFAQGGLYDLSMLMVELRELANNLSQVTTRLETGPADFLFRNNSESGVPTQ